LPNEEKKGITVKIDADLHAEVKQYLEEHGMTMAEFVTQALDNELHPKYQMKEGKSMENMRTVAFQVPEDLFQKIKDYLQRNHMTQKQFILGLIEDELERDLAEREGVTEAQEDFTETDEEEPEQEETAAVDDFEGVSEEVEEEISGENEDTEYSDDAEDESEDESEDEENGFCMQM